MRNLKYLRRLLDDESESGEKLFIRADPLPSKPPKTFVKESILASNRVLSVLSAPNLRVSGKFSDSQAHLTFAVAPTRSDYKQPPDSKAGTPGRATYQLGFHGLKTGPASKPVAPSVCCPTHGRGEQTADGRWWCWRPSAQVVPLPSGASWRWSRRSEQRNRGGQSMSSVGARSWGRHDAIDPKNC
jgi:hypothetical protein